MVGLGLAAMRLDMQVIACMQGLLEARFTRHYWAHENVSDWKPGSRWEHRRTDDARTLDLVGEVIESDPPRSVIEDIMADLLHQIDTTASPQQVYAALNPMLDRKPLPITAISRICYRDPTRLPQSRHGRIGTSDRGLRCRSGRGPEHACDRYSPFGPTMVG